MLLCDLDRDLCAYRARASDQKAETQGEFVHGTTVDGGGPVAKQNRGKAEWWGPRTDFLADGVALVNTMLKVGC